jgi:pSer/pThr/pTyr-binding forkhead associated (FHA) protein
VLNGEAENDVYTIKSSDGKITIGREKRVQGEDGFFRINTIAFPGDSKHESNKFISRQHAHIQFNIESGQFYLYAEENGIPPRNKTKIRTAESETPVKLYSTQIGYALKEGDQIMLGQSAILEFSYLNES